MGDRGRPILLDTNVVVRYLVNEPPRQAKVAARIVEGGGTVVLSPVILAECAYVLTSVYGIPRAAAVDALCDFLQRRNVELLMLPKSLAVELLDLCRGSKRVSFADALLLAEARHAGLPVTTFDRSFPTAGGEVEFLD